MQKLMEILITMKETRTDTDLLIVYMSLAPSKHILLYRHTVKDTQVQFFAQKRHF